MSHWQMIGGALLVSVIYGLGFWRGLTKGVEELKKELFK